MTIARAAAAALAALLLVTGCGATSPGADPDVAEEPGSGYVSGDGSIQRWEPGDRQGPVDLTGEDYTGTAIALDDLRGDVVVLNTWYAACPPCRAEAPDLVALSTDYADDGVQVLGINTRDDQGAAQAFERTFEVPYPSLDDRSGAAVAALQGVVAVQAVPTTVVLDTEGLVAARVLGRVEGSTLRVIVDEVLAEQAG